MEYKELIRKIIRESINDRTIKKISIFDFDGTLANTPNDVEGRITYKDVTGEDWQWKGWWGRKESLDRNVFDIDMITSTIDAYHKEKENPSTLVIMMTGRPKPLHDLIKDILDEHELFFDDYLYNKRGTLITKLSHLERFVSEYPSFDMIEMWEDRDDHVEIFREWGDSKNIKFKVNHVRNEL